MHPERVALEDGNGQLTYKEYRDLARKVGLFLMEKGFHNTKKPIGVVAGRDKYTLVLYMGILYSGNFYVPVDPELKEEKKQHIIEQLKKVVKDGVEYETAIKTGHIEEQLAVELFIIEYSKKKTH